jgi:hypothetical protein
MAFSHASIPGSFLSVNVLIEERLEVTAPTVTIQLMCRIFPDALWEGEIPSGEIEASS